MSEIELRRAREPSSFLEETSAISFDSNAGLTEFNSSNKKKEGVVQTDCCAGASNQYGAEVASAKGLVAA